MIALENCVAVLLCAGLSQRFGPGNKLLAPLDGRPLVAHAAELCRLVPLAGRIAVVPPGEPALNALLIDHGFELVTNSDPEAGKDSSLRLALDRALALGARGALVLLGDMPHVEAAHLGALSVAAGDEQASISIADGIMSPPTLIPANVAQLAVDRADRPVRVSLGEPAAVTAPRSMLVDYDTPAQLGLPPISPGSPEQRSSSEQI